MEGIKDILNRRADSLGTNQLTAMEAIKRSVFEITGINVGVVRLKNNVATVAVDNPVAATEIRLHAQEIIRRSNSTLPDNPLKSLRTTIN